MFKRFGEGIYSYRNPARADRFSTSCTTSPYRVMIACDTFVLPGQVHEKDDIAVSAFIVAKWLIHILIRCSIEGRGVYLHTSGWRNTSRLCHYVHCLGPARQRGKNTGISRVGSHLTIYYPMLLSVYEKGILTLPAACVLVSEVEYRQHTQQERLGELHHCYTLPSLRNSDRRLAHR